MSLEGASLGIYRVGAELGRGGMGTVYRAEATAEGPAGPAGSVVALKVFHPELVADAHAFARFRLEAEIGKEIRHDHLVRTYGMVSAEWEGQPYQFMVLELIEGRTLQSLLAELGTFPEHLLYEVADQILDALHEVHERGVVHRDIKPENVVITPDQRVLLMDLGVARRETGGELTQVGEFIGSLAYAPPEQFTATEVDRRADLYAFGVTLFELATGRRPFDESDLTVLIQQKLYEEIEPPRRINPDLEAFWDQVIFTCIRREKADRFASAGELRRILSEGERSEWWRLKTAGRVVPSAEHALKRLRLERRTPLVGRAGERDRLHATYARACRSGAVLFLSGPGGVGKSRLVYDYLESVAGAGGPAVAAGRGAGAGALGYGPFVEALADLLGPGAADRAAQRAALGERLHELLPDTPGVVEPLAEFLHGSLQPGPESGLSRDALFAAVVKMLRAMAAERPLVLVIEDLHLAGAESVELFAHVARCVPGHAVLLVGVYADDEVEEGSPLQAFLARAAGEEAVTHLALENLSATECEELLRFVVRHERTVRALGPTLQTKSDGSPLIVLEVLARLQERELLVEDEGGLELAGELDEIEVPSTVRDLVALKLAVLDDEQRETLEVAAALGVEFEASLLAVVLEERPIKLLQRLAGLERKHRLLTSSGKRSFRFASRQLFEATYETITPALRAEYHALVADTLLDREEAPEGERAYALLRHLFHADRALEATPWLGAALDHMAGNFHASFAAPFLEKVAEAFAAAPPAPRFAIAMRLWAFYELLASRTDQMRVLGVARELADQIGEPGPRARVHAYRAGSYWYAGHYDNAREEAEAGLELAREAADRKWESTCYHTLGVVAFRRGRLERCAAHWREALRIRREIGDRRGEASTLQALSLVMPAIGEGDKVLATMEQALAICREIGERRLEASMLINLGNRLVDEARYEEGLAHLEQAIEGHRETGALLEEALALTNLGRAQDILGGIDDAKAAWERALQLFVDLGNPSGELAARVMLGSALGTYGEHEEARAHLEAVIKLATRTGDRMRLAEAHVALGELLHPTGERAEAWAHLEEALALAEELKDARRRVSALAAAGKVALGEADYERATRHLTEALPDARGGLQAPLILCRLARAHHGASRVGEARECAREVLERLEAAGDVARYDSAEIYYTLHQIEEDEERRERFLVRAREILEERARRIRNGSYREYFLTRTWPNAEILARGRGPAADAASP
ncbi:MAG: serine/threonine-protein kinase [Planctomycetota bacterium]